MHDLAVRPLALAYSPCPNDTYIFAALTNGLLDNAPAVRVELDDVEALNTSAMRGDFELTKVSYGAIPHLLDKYRILRAGGALGHGCGPLVVTKAGGPKTLADLQDKLIAIPGEMTTAFLLLRLAMGPRPQTLQLRFDQIIEAVEQGIVDAGLIIHESRFTYAQHGLVAIADLGEWWESQTQLPIPLGAILARRDLSAEQTADVNAAIRRSLAFAREHEDQIIGYVREHAFETSEDVMRKHIELYVNEYSDDLGERGEAAVRELFKRAAQAGVSPELAEPEFA